MSSFPVSPISPLSFGDPSRLSPAFRERMRRTSWAEHAPRTVWGPVGSPASAVQKLERQLLALHRAHLKVLDLALAEPLAIGPDLGELPRLLRAVIAFYQDWPLLHENARTRPGARIPDPSASLVYGRPDIVMSADGPRVVETNFDTAVSGYEKPDDLWSISAELFGLEEAWLRSGRPLAGLRDYFAAFADGQPCLIHWVRSLAAAPECDPILAFLNQDTRGVRHIAHYAGEPSPAFSREIPGYLHRACSIYTVNRLRDQFTQTLRPLVPTLRGSTVPLGLSPLQSKLFLAWLSDPRARPRTLTPDEIEAVDALIPKTRLLQRLDGAEMDQVRHNRGDFVLKRTESHMGRHVFFGCIVGQAEWERLLRELPSQQASPSDPPSIWVVQERVHPQVYTLVEYTDEGPVERRTALSCSPYLLGGRIRGFETWRLPLTPDEQMLNTLGFIGHFLREPDDPPA